MCCGVEVVSREDAEAKFYVLLNLTETAQVGITLPHPMEDVIAGRDGVSKISLGPLDVTVLAAPKATV
jgi:hypothetical protein